MHKKFTFIILTNTGTLSRQVTISRPVLIFLCIATIICLTTFGMAAYKCLTLNKIVSGNQMLESKIVYQQDEIVSQHTQIQQFTDEINSFKSKLVELNKFEKKIRIIANIENSDGQESVFGIGGAIPGDIETNISVTEEHNSLLREMHEQTADLNVASIEQKKRFETLLKGLEDRRNLLVSTPAIRPTTGWITSRFGYRKSPFTGQQEFHNGLDIANREGTAIIATANGIVTYCGFKGLLGKTVIIDHGHGMISRYAHLSKIIIKPGEKVKRGDTIAELGNSGRSTGHHLHYDVRLNGISVNPAKYILN